MPANKPLRVKAGVVPVRSRAGGTEVCLVSAREYPDSWIFPTGTVEKGESLAETAARECREEAGLLVSVGEQLGVVQLEKKATVHHLTFFLGAVTDETDRWEADRRRRWVSPAEAVQTVAAPFVPIAEVALRILAQL